MESIHCSMRDKEFPLVIKRWRVFIGQLDIVSFHCSMRDREFPLVIKRWRVFFGQLDIVSFHWSMRDRKLYWSIRDGEFSLVN